MNFSEALDAVKSGRQVSRTGWNGSQMGIYMFIYLVPGSQFQVNRQPLLSVLPHGTEVTYRPHIDLMMIDDSGDITAQVWQPSNGDVMVDDWELVDYI